jgi:hypothetical protein
MADFSALMAEMIAKSRPQQAPPQTHPAVIGGAPIEATARSAKVGMDIGGLVKGYQALAGIATPEEKAQLAKEAEGTYESWKVLASMRTPEEMDMIELNPEYQAKMQEFAKAKIPGIMTKTNTTSPTGNVAYTWAPGPPDKAKWEAAMRALTIRPGTPEAMREVTKQPTDAEIQAGLVGAKPRQDLIDAQVGVAQRSRVNLPEEQAQRMEQLQANPNEVLILSGKLGADAAKTYVDNKRLSEQPQLHPQVAELYKAQVELTKEQAANYAAVARIDKTKADAYAKEADASAQLKLSEKAKIDNEIQSTKDSVIGKLPRETQLLLTEVDRAYNSSVAQLEKTYQPIAGMTTANYKNTYDKLSQMAELTNKHAVATNSVVPQYPGTAANIEYFTAQVERYIREQYTPIAQKKVGLLGSGGEQKTDAEKKAVALMRKVIDLHRKYAGTPTSFGVAKQYQDALKLMEQPTVVVPGAPSGQTGGVPQMQGGGN